MNKDLQNEVSCIKGVGLQTARKLNQIDVFTVEDLLLHLPHTYLAREYCRKISEMEVNKRYKIIVRLSSIKQSYFSGRRRQLRAIFTDGQTELQAIWFHYKYWQLNDLKPGVFVVLNGLLKKYRNTYQMVHPEYQAINTEILYPSFSADDGKEQELLPVYPLTAGLNQNTLRKIIKQAYRDFHDMIKETLPDYIRKEYSLTNLQETIQTLHFPETGQKIRDARKRLCFEELFYHQMMLARIYKKNSFQNKGISFVIKKKNTTKLKNSLTFSLTAAQKKVLREIIADMQSLKRMNRLLQGDVGSGKTIVALFAMLLAIENGYQAVMLVPTEILAKQHCQNISKLLAEQPEIKVSLILGGNRKGTKEALQDIISGNAQLIIGTHALLEERVIFKQAGLVVIDEQQRFGVQQRSVLPDKIGFPDILYLSATPIPRSLALTVYGDLDISILDELPPYRKPVKTILRPAEEKEEIYQEIPRYINKGRQVYIVCPLISETEKLDLLDAERLYRNLKDLFCPAIQIDLIHSRMKAADKEAIMQRFQKKETDILVSTTVIEVGVDVPNASVMIIEHAERFGLSQLHQLRGRVGRGSEEAFCFLVAYKPLSQAARKRLKIMTATNDGFLVAEKDLEIRGPGEFFGTNQAGVPLFRFTDLTRDMEILRQARTAAREIVLTDFFLTRPENSSIKERYRKVYQTKEELFSY